MSIPWCEKYRPVNFAQTVLEKNNRKIFDNILKNARFPNLLLYGPPGVGKTTTVENLINAFQEIHYKRNKENVIHLNASDERGIEVIRTQIYQFVKSKNMFQTGYKFVILDEVDYMTKNAQQALKNLLQCCGKNVKFCLICNYICKIEESLKNEFICIRFNQLPQKEITYFLETISVNEGLHLDDKTIQTIQKIHQSDIRSMVNFLQLHQETSELSQYLFDNTIWETLHELFKENKRDEIYLWIDKMMNRSCINMDVKSCFKSYFNYVIENDPVYINSNFLNICETLLHTQNNPYLTNYFVEHVLFHNKN
jgi:replication factor C subunit 3/5